MAIMPSWSSPVLKKTKTKTKNPSAHYLSLLKSAAPEPWSQGSSGRWELLGCGIRGATCCVLHQPRSQSAFCWVKPGTGLLRLTDFVGLERSQNILRDFGEFLRQCGEIVDTVFSFLLCRGGNCTLGK